MIEGCVLTVLYNTLLPTTGLQFPGLVLHV